MPKHYDILLLGHLSRSVHIKPDGEKLTWMGGALWYGVHSAFAGGNKVGAVVKCAPEDNESHSILPIPLEDIYYCPAKTSMSIRSTFFSSDKERRRSEALSLGEPFTIADIPDATADVYHMAALMSGDFDPEVIVALSKRGPVSIDVQGLLRCPNETGEMITRDWPEKMKYFPYITYLKTDAAEAEILTGLSDRREAAKVLHSWGPKEVMISYNQEMMVYDGADFAVWPVVARNLSGRSGRGDTTIAAYITERLRTNMSDALRYATAAASLKMESPGPLKASRVEIEAYMEQFLPDPSK